MSKRSRISSNSIDWITLTVFFSLLIIGWLMLYAAVYDKTNPYAYLDFSSSIGKQTIWLGIAVVTFVIVYVIEWEFWNSFAFPIYAVTILLLVLVLIFGNEIKGAKSWFLLFGMSFQPSEIAKFATALAVSSFLSSYKSDIRNRNTLLISLGLIGLPMFLILLQPDAGSALIFLSFFILFYRSTDTLISIQKSMICLGTLRIRVELVVASQFATCNWLIGCAELYATFRHDICASSSSNYLPCKPIFSLPERERIILSKQ